MCAETGAVMTWNSTTRSRVQTTTPVRISRASAVINMPTAEQAAATPRQTARRTVVAQSRDFNAYRRGVAGPGLDLDEQHAANDAARERNARVAAEVSDLKEGLEMVEEKARSELGMVRPDEILVQVSARK